MYHCRNKTKHQARSRSNIINNSQRSVVRARCGGSGSGSGSRHIRGRSPEVLFDSTPLCQPKNVKTIEISINKSEDRNQGAKNNIKRFDRNKPFSEEMFEDPSYSVVGNHGESSPAVCEDVRGEGRVQARRRQDRREAGQQGSR